MPRPAPIHATALAFLLTIAGQPAAADGQFEFGPYRISVARDDNPVMSTTDYQIVVANEELTLTRLTATYDGTLSKSYVSDLDGDGRFEVIVTFSRDAGHETGIHLYSWNGQLLEPRKVAPLAADQRAGYRGSDEIAVSSGALVRVYQVFEQQGEQWRPTAAQRRLRYSLSDARWLVEP